MRDKTIGLRFATSLLLVTVTSGCATHPDELGAASVSPLRYAQYDCRQISIEQVRVEEDSNRLYTALEDKADTDDTQAWTSALLWPTLFWLDGDGPQAAEYRQLRGEYKALHEASVMKNCDLTFKKLKPESKESAKDTAKTKDMAKPVDITKTTESKGTQRPL